MLVLAIVALLVLGLGELAAFVAVACRYAMPAAPPALRWLLAPAMIGASGTCFALGWIGLAGPEEVFGLGALALLVAHFACQAAVFWVLNFYSLYWSFGRSRP